MSDELWDLEHQGWASLCRSTGADFYGDLMTAGGVMVLAHGQVLDRAAVVASLNEAPPWRGYELSEQRVVARADDHAVLEYTGRAFRGGDEPEFRALMSSVYVREEGRWRLALYQQTPIPQS